MAIVNIYGGGPTALMIAHQLYDLPGMSVNIYERNNNVGRKFLVAGKGGFNLSHSKDLKEMKKLYSPAGFMDEAITSFPSRATRKWLQSLNIPTFIGSSGRIYPKIGIKPITVLQNILHPLLKNNVKFHTNSKFSKWSEDGIFIISNDKETLCSADYHIFCLGGSSWSKTGSDGSWSEILKKKNIKVNDFGPSNCGIECSWPKEIIDNHAGKPLKNIEISLDSKKYKGEATISEYGLEGNAIYPFASYIDQKIAKGKKVQISIDFKPQWTSAYLKDKLIRTKGTTSERLSQVGLDRVKISVIKSQSSREIWLQGHALVGLIKSTRISILNTRSIEESISTTGGVAISELNEKFELKEYKNHFCAGEMVDWDTITGGYLLQGCFSMGFTIGNYIRSKYQSLI